MNEKSRKVSRRYQQLERLCNFRCKVGAGDTIFVRNTCKKPELVGRIGVIVGESETQVTAGLVTSSAHAQPPELDDYSRRWDVKFDDGKSQPVKRMDFGVMQDCN